MRAGGRFRLVATAALLAAVVAAACSGPSGPTVSPAAAPTPTPSSPGAPSVVASPSASGSPSASAPPSSSGAVLRDPSLLAILPAAVAGVAVGEEPGSMTDALSDPDFVANVQAAVFATVVAADDLASGVVARLRPGVYSDGFFRDWRDTYDKGACGQAGSVVGNAEAQLGGRTVYITSCAGGLLVYHAYVAERDVVVSVFSIGARRFGEQLMAGLRP